MSRLLTGYAVWFNKKYRRHGQLFQNRYKSILCQEDPYLKELVRAFVEKGIAEGSRPDLDGEKSFMFLGASQTWDDNGSHRQKV
jgi:putative transposase